MAETEESEVDDWGMPLDPEKPCPVCGMRLVHHGLARFKGCQEILWARTLKEKRARGERLSALDGKVMGLVFQKPSLRTRIS